MNRRDPSSPAHNGKGRQRLFLDAVAVAMSVFEWSGKIISVATLGIMFFALFANVVLRYAFGSGLAWAYEIHAVLLPWLVAGGIVIAATRSRNIAISLLPDMVQPGTRRVLFLAVQIAILVIAVSVLWSSQPILKASQFQKLSTLGIKQIWGYSSLVYAFGAMAVIAALETIRTVLSGPRQGTDPAHGSLS
ncbi:TRAP transporter small permease [Pseudogemmobacter sp. W21_MBD1_M6]|uniref:TRAP transporter small permease n=1 Tax=Pseudogemmobacter sp. W21_MBD1_M6 TaxID=3240271 RepID=UPI003F9A3CB3